MYIDCLRYWDLSDLRPDQARFLADCRRGIEGDSEVIGAGLP
jgi:hypothetical protein